MPVPIAPLAIAGAALGLGSIAANMNAVDSANAAAARANDKAWERELEMWNMNNEYNTPANQMARLKAAGLSPYLAYSNGASGGTASAMSPPSAERVLPYEFGNPLANMLSLIQGLQQYKSLQETIQGQALDNQAKALSNQYLEDNLRYRNQLLGYQGQKMGSDYTNSLWKGVMLRKYGETEHELGIDLLRNRISASSLDKQLNQARLNLLFNQSYGQTLVNRLRKQLVDYQDKYEYGGRKDYANRALNVAERTLPSLVEALTSGLTKGIIGRYAPSIAKGIGWFDFYSNGHNYR